MRIIAREIIVTRCLDGADNNRFDVLAIRVISLADFSNLAGTCLVLY